MVTRTKKCSLCNEVKPRSEFYTKDKAKKKLSCRCKLCDHERVLKKQRSLHGLPIAILSRQKYRSKQREHPMPNYSGEELREWMLQQEKYHTLHREWVASNYNKDKAPSVDRINDYLPYTIGNIQLMTWKENDLKHHSDRKTGRNNKTNKAISQYSLNGDYIRTFHSIQEAGRTIKGNPSHISAAARGKHKHARGFKWRMVPD